MLAGAGVLCRRFGGDRVSEAFSGFAEFPGMLPRTIERSWLFLDQLAII